MEDKIAAIVVDFDVNSPAGIIISEVVDLVYKDDLEYACSVSLLDALLDKSDRVFAFIVRGDKDGFILFMFDIDMCVVLSRFNDLCEVVVYFWRAIGEFPAEFAGFVCNKNFAFVNSI